MGLVVVTGVAGFIGSHLAKRLIELDYYVVGVDDFSSGEPGRVTGLLASRRFRLVVGDVRDPVVMRQALGGEGEAEAVFHLAAVSSVGQAEADPVRAFSVNVLGTLSVLESARARGAGRVIYASSSAVYGEPERLPVSEDHPLRPANAYGASKVLAEEALWAYRSLYGVRATALRLFNVYGPCMRRGQDAPVVSRFIEALLSHGRPVIHGDGLQTRDFVYISDAVDAFVRAMRAGFTGPVNVGSGVETRIVDLYRLLCSLIGYCPEPVSEPAPKGMVRRMAADTSRAAEVLGWRPKTSLRDGLARTVWFYSRTSSRSNCIPVTITPKSERPSGNM